MDAPTFAALARDLAEIAHGHGLNAPAFVGRTTGPQRVITRTASGCIVKVRRDREHREVANDMIAGIVKTNGVPESHPAVVEMMAESARMRMEGAR